MHGNSYIGALGKKVTPKYTHIGALGKKVMPKYTYISHMIHSTFIYKIRICEQRATNRALNNKSK